MPYKTLNQLTQNEMNELQRILNPLYFDYLTKDKYRKGQFSIYVAPLDNTIVIRFRRTCYSKLFKRTCRFHDDEVIYSHDISRVGPYKSVWIEKL